MGTFDGVKVGIVGLRDGDEVGAVGFVLGNAEVGFIVGSKDGLNVGVPEGRVRETDGTTEGSDEGVREGEADGATEGSEEGVREGEADGATEGSDEGAAAKGVISVGFAEGVPILGLLVEINGCDDDATGGDDEVIIGSADGLVAVDGDGTTETVTVDCVDGDDEGVLVVPAIGPSDGLDKG